MIAVSPMTTPVPWSMKKLAPIFAPGWISIPVAECAVPGDDAGEQGNTQQIELVSEPMAVMAQSPGQ